MVIRLILVRTSQILIYPPYFLEDEIFNHLKHNHKEPKLEPKSHPNHNPFNPILLI